MFWTKLKIATAVLVVGSVFGLGGGLLLNGTAGGQQIEFGKGAEKPAIRQADQPKEKPDAGKKEVANAKTDHENLRGTWKVVEVKIGGKDFPSLKDSHWSIGRDKMAMHYLTESATKPSNGWLHVSYHFWGDNEDASPAPNNINLTFHSVTTFLDKNKVATNSQTYRGLFALEGDTLKLCYRERGIGKRPNEMPQSSSKDDNLWIVVLERETAAPKIDEEKLQGDWEMIGVEIDGEQMELSKDETRFLSFVGDLRISSEHEGITSFKLDGTKSPKQFIQIWESDWVGLKTVGIYSLDGDQLKICNPEAGKDAPPDEFSAAAGSSRTLITLKRVKSVGEGESSFQGPGRKDTKEDKPAQKEEGKKHEKADAGMKDVAIAKSDDEKWRGRWKVVEWNYEGKKQNITKDVNWSIGKDKIVMNHALISNWLPIAAYRLYGEIDGPTPFPNKIDMTTKKDIPISSDEGMLSRSQVFQGIFVWDGDRLKLCFRHHAYGKRPAEIPASPTKDENLLIVILERDPPFPQRVRLAVP